MTRTQSAGGHVDWVAPDSIAAQGILQHPCTATKHISQAHIAGSKDNVWNDTHPTSRLTCTHLCGTVSYTVGYLCIRYDSRSQWIKGPRMMSNIRRMFWVLPISEKRWFEQDVVKWAIISLGIRGARVFSKMTMVIRIVSCVCCIRIVSFVSFGLCALDSALDEGIGNLNRCWFAVLLCCWFCMRS